MNDNHDQAPHEPSLQPSDGSLAVAPLPPPVPAGLRNIWRKWLSVTTRPGVTAFACELPTANWYDTLVSLVALGFLSAVVDVILQRSDAQILPIPHWDGTIAGTTIPNWLAGIVYMAFLPLGFLAFEGIFYIVARGLGGKGNFLDQAYAVSLYYVPVVGVVIIVNQVPIVGHVVGLVFIVYEVVLMAIAIAASQHFTVGRSVLVLVTTPLLLLLSIFVIVNIVVALGILLHHPFSPR